MGMSDRGSCFAGLFLFFLLPMSDVDSRAFAARAAVRVRWFPWDVRVDDCVRVTLSSVLKFRNEIFECGS